MGRGGGLVGLGGQGGCERRIEVVVKDQKKIMGGRGEGSGWGRVRVDVNKELNFWKIPKKNGGGVGCRFGGGGVRVDVNEELKCLGKLKKRLGGGGPGGLGGVRVDVNEELKFL